MTLLSTAWECGAHVFHIWAYIGGASGSHWECSCSWVGRGDYQLLLESLFLTPPSDQEVRSTKPSKAACAVGGGRGGLGPVWAGLAFTPQPPSGEGSKERDVCAAGIFLFLKSTCALQLNWNNLFSKETEKPYLFSSTSSATSKVCPRFSSARCALLLPFYPPHRLEVTH